MLGRKLTRLLLAGGSQVRAMTRIVAHADELKSYGARPVRADLRDPDALEFALRGTRAVVASAHAMLGRGEASSEAIDYEGHRNLIDAAREAGVEHFVYVSVLGASLDHPIDFWRNKARVERYLADSGLTHTVIRPSAFMDLHAYQLIGKAVVEGKRVVLFGKGRNPRNFVAAEDVAKAISGILEIPAMRGQSIDMGGPENLSGHEVIEVFERVSGRKAKVTHVPIPALKAMSKAIRPVHPGISRVIQSGILSETTDQKFDPSQFRTRVPITLTTLEEWAKARTST